MCHICLILKRTSRRILSHTRHTHIHWNNTSSDTPPKWANSSLTRLTFSVSSFPLLGLGGQTIGMPAMCACVNLLVHVVLVPLQIELNAKQYTRLLWSVSASLSLSLSACPLYLTHSRSQSLSQRKLFAPRIIQFLRRVQANIRPKKKVRRFADCNEAQCWRLYSCVWGQCWNNRTFNTFLFFLCAWITFTSLNWTFCTQITILSHRRPSPSLVLSLSFSRRRRRFKPIDIFGEVVLFNWVTKYGHMSFFISGEASLR